MEITNIVIYKKVNKGPVLAYANVIVNDCFIIRGITLLETEKNGRFISMPTRRIKSSKKRVFRDMCHPLNSEIRKLLTDAVFSAYDESIKDNEE